MAVLLATVDLEPYLISHKEINDEQTVIMGESSESAADSAISSSEQSVVQPAPAQASPEKTFENNKTPLNDDNSEQEHFTDLLPAEGEEAAQSNAEDQVEIYSSPLLEMEVTILPVGEYPYSILLETFTDREIAQMAIPFYRKRGISAHWVKVDLNDGIFYRLFTGVFATISEAQQFVDKKQLVDKPIKPTIYSARIGVYQDKSQLRSAYTKISETSINPYILGTEEGTYYLYVGSFYTFIGAADQCRDLNDAGFSCEPVKRSTITPL